MDNRELAKLIGSAAKHARKERAFTQEDAAERIGVSVEFYARIERGRALPSVSTFRKMADGLGISADTLLDRAPEEGKLPVWQPKPPSDSPEIRRLLRHLRKATPATLRVVTGVVKEFNKHTAGASDDDSDES